MSAIEEIQKKVLALPIDQRVFLAVSLLESLPLAGDERTESEELAEVERREMQIERAYMGNKKITPTERMRPHVDVEDY